MIVLSIWKCIHEFLFFMVQLSLDFDGLGRKPKYLLIELCSWDKGVPSCSVFGIYGLLIPTLYRLLLSLLPYISFDGLCKECSELGDIVAMKFINIFFSLIIN